MEHSFSTLFLFLFLYYGLSPDRPFVLITSFYFFQKNKASQRSVMRLLIYYKETNPFYCFSKRLVSI
jgi:hypothetical protein